MTHSTTTAERTSAATVLREAADRLERGPARTYSALVVVAIRRRAAYHGGGPLAESDRGLAALDLLEEHLRAAGLDWDVFGRPLRRTAAQVGVEHLRAAAERGECRADEAEQAAPAVRIPWRSGPGLDPEGEQQYRDEQADADYYDEGDNQ